MSDDELFEDLEDFGDLDETPDFDIGEEEFMPDFGEPGDGEGLSRTFKIVGAIMAFAVIVIIALILFFALRGGNELTGNERTSTAVVQLNQTIEAEYNATLTALALIESASQTAVFHSEETATADAIIRQTQAAIAATDAANTATAEFIANQTQWAMQTATQDAINIGLTQTAEANTLTGQVVDENGRIFGNVTLRLYKDDGDGVFTPADREPVEPTPVPAVSSGETAANAIAYGESKGGTLNAGQSVEWIFSGQQGEVVTIDAAAAQAGQIDAFLELVGPDGTILIGDDDSGGNSNARISAFELPVSGAFTIRVSSVAGSGDYVVSLALTAGAASGYVPVQHGSDIVLVARVVRGPGEIRAQGGTPIPITDELIAVITTATDGTFDFGALEPGVYWLELDYNSLPDDMKALVSPGEPLVIMVQVPAVGAVTFTIGVPPTATPTTTPSPTESGPSPFDLTATAFAEQGIEITMPPTVTEASPIPPTETPAALPTTGFFSDLGDGASGLSGGNGLTLLAIAAAGLVAVVFIARKLRTAA